MADIREELASAIAEKYLELEALSRQAGAYGAMRLDWARYGEDGLDGVLEAFCEGLDEFDRQLSGALSDGDYVRAALEGIMEQRGMDDEQRARFLGTVKAFAEQSGPERLMDLAEGRSDSVLRALMRMSETAPGGEQSAEGALDEICRRADRSARPDFKRMEGERADELLRCYAAYCVLRDGRVEGESLNGGCLRLIGSTVRAGRQQSDTLLGREEGRITGERAAEVLRAIAEVLLVALALFVSGAAGVWAAMSIMGLAGLLVGVTGALSKAALMLALAFALPAGVKVTCDALKLCARAGEWLERVALEPGAARVAGMVNEGCAWLDEKVAPAVRGAWQGACAAGRGAYDSLRPRVDEAVEGVRRSAGAAWESVKPHLDRAVGDAVGWMEQTAEDMGGALTHLMSALRMDGGEGRA